jgi:hypothetical protein
MISEVWETSSQYWESALETSEASAEYWEMTAITSFAGK